MNYKKILLTIVSILIIFLAVVLGKNCLSYKLPNSAMGVRSIVNLKSVDTLFIGSSGYRKGIDMEEIVNSLEGSSFMLTYNGNEPFNIYIELKELLNEGVDIGRLIVDFNPSMADRGADLSDKRLLWDISMDSKLELWNALKKEETTDLFTFYDYWVLSNNDYMVTYPVSYRLISSRYNYGGSTSLDESAGKTREELEAMPVIEKPGINPLQEESIRNIIKLCSNNSIELIFMESPRYITMENDENYRAKSEMMKDIIESEGAKVILRSDLEFDNSKAEYYSDLTHMSGDGKRELTGDIIALLKNN